MSIDKNISFVYNQSIFKVDSEFVYLFNPYHYMVHHWKDKSVKNMKIRVVDMPLDYWVLR